MKSLFFISLLFLISCCPQIKTDSKILRDTVITLKYDTIHLENKPKIIILRDTIIPIKPFKAVTDTIIKYKTRNVWKYDTIRLETVLNSASDIRHKFSFRSSADSIFTFNERQILTQEKERTFLDMLYENLVYLAVGFLLGCVSIILIKAKN